MREATQLYGTCPIWGPFDSGDEVAAEVGPLNFDTGVEGAKPEAARDAEADAPADATQDADADVSATGDGAEGG